jgi:formylglycine-generating enzyme required for sulfatase activity
VQDPDAVPAWFNELIALKSELLLANPLLDFDRLLLVKRGEGNMGLPQNWQGNCALSSKGYDNEIAVLSPVRPGGKMTTFYKPDNGAFVGDVDLNFDADKMLFSMPGSNDRWQIWEIKADGSGLRQVTLGEEPDVDNYDACYLPDGRITFGSTRCFQGVPCVGGGNTVANFCRMDPDGKNARQLCFDQDHNWCPTVLNTGRLLYTRWEYSDTPHYFSRLLFNMNPDGTNQCEYYKSNSFWPNSIFYARPIPGSPTAVVAIVSGHHGVPRMGELIIFDPAKGRFEADGVVQRIPGYGKKVEPVIMDTLVDAVWPKFLHPYPLSDKYFLVSCKPTPESQWGLYLVDVFDNMLLLAETPGYALLEPVPFRNTTRPPVIPDRVKLDRNEATVYLTDVYRGPGLKGVPRGTVKNLRVYEFHYTYPQIGGHINIGVEGPWDVHRILGTVPVYEDGSAYFKIPANTPIAVQPLDAQGRALQLMRSWFVGMPGEAVSCVGCHERQNMTPPATQTLAALAKVVDITPWKGPARGFSFKRDVQPALDKFCVGCHNGAERPDGQKLPDLARKDHNGWGNFTPSYLALHPYVRRPGPESDYHLQKPAEFCANTSELIQMLEKGHHGVKLDGDAWERLYTWIDLNVPDHGTWAEHHATPSNFHERRLEMRTKYANRPEDPEVIPDLKQEPVAFVQPAPVAVPAQEPVQCDGWPFNAHKAAHRQKAAGAATRRTVGLGNGVTMDLVLIPGGEFVMGSTEGFEDERPLNKVQIDAPFWMGVVEVTNAQYQQFDPRHDSGFIDQHHKDHTTPGYPAQAPANPVIRVTWTEAMEFCRWLSDKAGGTCALPTEAQWEWACRAGTNTPFSYGGLDTDFSTFANLGDLSLKLLAVDGINPQPIPNPSPYQDYLPKDARFNDGARIVTEVGKYQPNPWGLQDMHGNVAEWTLSAFRPYPYVASDGREDPKDAGRKAVRGGSWADRPKFARSAYRLAYDPWQPVYNVGFRVVVRTEPATKVAARSTP